MNAKQGFRNFVFIFPLDSTTKVCIYKVGNVVGVDMYLILCNCWFDLTGKQSKIELTSYVILFNAPVVNM